jgi:hypothetical protein
MSFDFEHTTAMSIAFDEICRELRLAKQERASRELIAERVIEFAQRGECDPPKLKAQVLAAIMH